MRLSFCIVRIEGCGRTPGSSAALFSVLAFVLAAATAQAQPAALINRYCVTCHNQRLKTAKLELATLDVSRPPKDPLLWERAIRKLPSGLMPTPRAPRP